MLDPSGTARRPGDGNGGALFALQVARLQEIPGDGLDLGPVLLDVGGGLPQS